MDTVYQTCKWKNIYRWVVDIHLCILEKLVHILLTWWMNNTDSVNVEY